MASDSGYDPTEQALYTRVASYDAAGDTANAQAAAQQLRSYQAQQAAAASSGASSRAASVAQSVAAPAAAPAPPQEPAAYTPQARAILNGPLGTAESFLSGAVGQIPFGQTIEDAEGAGLNAGVNALSQMTGGNVNIPYHYDPQAVRQTQDAAQAAQPAASLAGNVTGLGTSAVAGLALGGAGDVGEAGNFMTTLGKTMGIGGGLGAAQAGVGTADNELAAGKSLNPGEIATNAAYGGAAGAVAAPIVSGVTGLGAKMIQGAGTKAWGYVAKNLGMSVADLQASLDAQRAAGLTPSIQQVLTDQAAGTVRSVADKNPVLAAGLRTGAATAEQELPTSVSTAIQQTPMPARPANLANVPDQAQTPMALANANSAAHASALAQIGNNTVSIPADMVSEPGFIQSLQGPKWRDVRDSVYDAQTEDADGNPVQGDVDLTISQADRVRQQLNRVSQQPGGPGSPLADLADDFRSHVREASPEYDQALTEYAKGDNYTTAFQHAVQGSSADAATNSDLQNALGTAEGAAGHTAGTLTYVRNQALSNPAQAASTADQLSSNTARATFLQNQPGSAPTSSALGQIASANRALSLSTPGSVRPAPDDTPGIHAAIGALEGATGHPIGAFGRISRAVTTWMGGQNFPVGVQQDFVRGLTSRDPQLINQTLSRLQQAGASAAQIRRLQAVAGAIAGRTAGQVFGE